MKARRTSRIDDPEIDSSYWRKSWIPEDVVIAICDEHGIDIVQIPAPHLKIGQLPAVSVDAVGAIQAHYLAGIESGRWRSRRYTYERKPDVDPQELCEQLGITIDELADYRHILHSRDALSAWDARRIADAVAQEDSSAGLWARQLAAEKPDRPLPTCQACGVPITANGLCNS